MARSVSLMRRTHIFPSIQNGLRNPSSDLASLFNGYFSLPFYVHPDIQLQDDALQNLNLACRESHAVFLSEFPETMIIFEEPFSTATATHRRRMLRCSPARDILFVTKANLCDWEQKHFCFCHKGTRNLSEQPQMEWSQQRPDVFANFRYIILSFRVMASSLRITFRAMSRLGNSSVFSDFPFQKFLAMFEELEHLYLCADPRSLRSFSGWERLDRVEKSRGGVMEAAEFERSNIVLEWIMNRNAEYVQSVR